MSETAPAKLVGGHLAARGPRRTRSPEDRHPFFDQLEKFLKNKTGVAGLIIIVVFTLVAILAPVITPHDPNENALYDQLKPPIWTSEGALKNLLGTDDMGRDLLTRIIYGARVSLTLGVVSVGIAFLIGSFLGAIAGFYKGWPDNLIMRIMDIILAFPHILLAIVIVAYLGPGLRNAMIAIGIINIPRFARIVRASVMEEYEKDYVTAARAVGSGKPADHLQRDLPELPGPDHRPGEPRLRRGDPRCGGFKLPRSRGAAASVRVGGDDCPGEAAHPAGLVGNDLSGDRHPLRGPGFQPSGRRPARRPGSEAEGLTWRQNGHLLEIRNLRTYFDVRGGVLKAVDDVSITIDAGETLGLVGESACGKSVTASSVMRLIPIPPGRIAGGEILFEGVDILKLREYEMRRIRGKAISMIFPGADDLPESGLSGGRPGLGGDHPPREALQTGGPGAGDRGLQAGADPRPGVKDRRLSPPDERRDEAARDDRHGLGLPSEADDRRRADDGPRRDDPGADPRPDEPAQGGDGPSILFITHDLGVIAEMAQKVAVMYAGKIMEVADVDTLFAEPKHPYTVGLMCSIPVLGIGAKQQRLCTIPGVVPSLQPRGGMPLP